MNAHVPAGIVLPAEFLSSPYFQFLAAFVAINTIMYVALAVASMLPKVHRGVRVSRRGRGGENRSIHPDDHFDE
jgi:hypothetical protein